VSGLPGGLIQTVFPCYAPADREAARRIAEFLERGVDVRVFLEEGEIRAGEDLIAKAREARMADIAVVLFSRESMPPRWSRAQWEGALVTEPAAEGVRMAFVRCDDCVPPKVLAPQFTLRQIRQLKRWVRGHAPETERRYAAELEVLGIAVADRPGSETVDSSETAREFARAFRQDFDAVVTLDCAARSRAAMAGDVAAQLGLRLEGQLEENIERLRAFCEERRLLIVLEGADTDEAFEFVFHGRCSSLISAGPAGPRAADSIREIQDAFHQRRLPWQELCALARRGRRELRESGRLAELFELMQQWRAAAEEQGERGAVDESARELVWILEGWGMTEEARRMEIHRAAEFEDQMMLPFA
jgi:hypothetical protein